jgi:tRNA pseudouridine32 synthase/23S rRNA pseudouridine746 synthase
MKTVPGVANACSHIQLLEVKGTWGLFSLQPVTGKTHQLRLHINGLGFKNIDGRIYPTLQPERDDDFNRPLQLLAKQVRFPDPVSGQVRGFRSELGLLW